MFYCGLIVLLKLVCEFGFWKCVCVFVFEFGLFIISVKMVFDGL